MQESANLRLIPLHNEIRSQVQNTFFKVFWQIIGSSTFRCTMLHRSSQCVRHANFSDAPVKYISVSYLLVHSFWFWQRARVSVRPFPSRASQTFLQSPESCTVLIAKCINEKLFRSLAWSSALTDASAVRTRKCSAFRSFLPPQTTATLPKSKSPSS